MNGFLLRLRARLQTQQIVPSICVLFVLSVLIALALIILNDEHDRQARRRPLPESKSDPGRPNIVRTAAKPRVKPKRDIVSPQQRWRKVLPALKKADEQRTAAFERNSQEFRNSALSIVTTEGINTFVDEALGWNSKLLSLKDSDEHRRWLRDLYATHVLPLEPMRQLLISYTQSLDTALVEIDNKVLVDIQADVALDPKSVRVVASDTALLDGQLKSLIYEVQEEVERSTAKSISSFFFGAAGFEVGRQVSRGLMQDDSGEVGLLGELVSWGIGFAAEEATRKVADEVLQTRRAIENDLRSAANALIESCTSRGEICDLRASAVGRHQMAVFQAITNSLSLNHKWAASNYR